MAPNLAQADDADLAQCLNAPNGSEQKQCKQALFQNAANEMPKTCARVMGKPLKPTPGIPAQAMARSGRDCRKPAYLGNLSRCRVQGRRRARRRIGQDGLGVRLSR
jgi:hypothetical protein